MAVTMTAPAQREREGAYARLEERILARDQVGASQVFLPRFEVGAAVVTTRLPSSRTLP